MKTKLLLPLLCVAVLSACNNEEDLTPVTAVKDQLVGAWSVSSQTWEYYDTEGKFLNTDYRTNLPVQFQGNGTFYRFIFSKQDTIRGIYQLSNTGTKNYFISFEARYYRPSEQLLQNNEILSISDSEMIWRSEARNVTYSKNGTAHEAYRGVITTKFNKQMQ